MYKSSIHFERTKEEIKNSKASWSRGDRAFFAAGACHILAYVAQEMYPKKDYEIIYIKPREPFYSGNHVYIRDGLYAFDAGGWTLENELLNIFLDDYRNEYSGWGCDIIKLKCNIGTFCEENDHRKPEEFYGDVYSRAKLYIQSII